MPGPKMGPRPPDFDESIIKRSPTYLKWMRLEPGQKLRYACREFIKGYGDDEERLMRRILIARRNNVRDHETLKQARKFIRPRPNGKIQEQLEIIHGIPPMNVATEAPSPAQDVASSSLPQLSQTNSPTLHYYKNGPPRSIGDEKLLEEMDVKAVEATRSYKAWNELNDGQEFVYNQRYTKGQEGHDWLLRKNIWRRMKYRRENKKIVQQLQKKKLDSDSTCTTQNSVGGTEEAPGEEQHNPNETSGDATVGTTANLLKLDGQVESTDDQVQSHHPSALQVSAAAAAAILDGAAEGHNLDSALIMDPAAMAAAVTAALAAGSTSVQDGAMENPKVKDKEPVKRSENETSDSLGSFTKTDVTAAVENINTPINMDSMVDDPSQSTAAIAAQLAQTLPQDSVNESVATVISDSAIKTLKRKRDDSHLSDGVVNSKSEN